MKPKVEPILRKVKIKTRIWEAQLEELQAHPSSVKNPKKMVIIYGKNADDVQKVAPSKCLKITLVGVVETDKEGRDRHIYKRGYEGTFLEDSTPSAK